MFQSNDGAKYSHSDDVSESEPGPAILRLSQPRSACTRMRQIVRSFVPEHFLSLWDRLSLEVLEKDESLPRSLSARRLSPWDLRGIPYLLCSKVGREGRSVRGPSTPSMAASAAEEKEETKQFGRNARVI